MYWANSVIDFDGLEEKTRPGAWDVVVRDVFDAGRVPGACRTPEFVAACRRALGPGGLYLANVVSAPREIAASELAAVRGVFEVEAVLVVADAAAARAAVAAGTAECHVDYPKDPLSQPIDVRGRDLGLFESSRYGAVALAVFRTSVTNRIGDPALARLATAPPDVQLVTYADGSPTPGIAGVIAPGIFLVLFYLAVIMLGNQMLNVTLEEKENRVTEMILTTMNPTTLIVGKVLALVLIGIVQGVVVAIPTAVVVSLLTGDLGGAAAPGVPVLGSIPFDAGAVAVGFALFLLSFLMFTGLLVAIGAVMPSAKEAGNTFGVMIMAMFIPLYAASLLVSDPHGPVSQIFTFFPLTAPVSALLRNATGGLDAWEAALALVILGVFGWLFLTLGVRLFRTGSISYGSRVNILRALRGSSRR